MSIYDKVMKAPDGPHGWIQWKGTDVCMDVYCECGAHCHLDADFAYFIQCPHCKRVYQCDGHIRLVEMTLEEMASESHCDVQVASRDEDMD